jgi:hypothetical protein
MLGALEVKAIRRLVLEYGSQWRPVHAAVMACLLAHRNRRSGNCWPHRKDVAEYCNVSLSTVDRALARLTAWGAIERMQPRAVSSQQFRPAQYTFLFPLPQSVQKACESEDKTCENQPEPCVKTGGSRASKQGGAVRHLGDARNKEVRERSKGKDLKGKGSPRGEDYEIAKSRNSKQPAWRDERDLRMWAMAWRKLAKRDASGATACAGMSPRQIFEAACSIAGVTIARGLELDKLRKKWPEKVPDWLKETG